ncbi:DUF896 domain-containing protein [Paenibacillus sp. 481]|uniref:DUF896 domain-containing protein n=1 Tax=Paenibacillus sp. 481 TaxID=2835869 RepID=UPI001E3D9D1A|nr:DUF896 domain-containing protein [Paenibacillus sp. 481]UHA73085.1 DUF896 domain-containing protein [Paenibacillus sp. 481]
MNLDQMIARINELARKHKSVGLTEEELAERAQLREKYLVQFRKQVRNNLDTIQWVEDEQDNNDSKPVVH